MEQAACPYGALLSEFETDLPDYWVAGGARFGLSNTTLPCAWSVCLCNHKICFLFFLKIII